MRYTQNANFSIHCALSVEEILSIRLAGGGHRKPDAVANGHRSALFDSGKSFYMCACRQDDYARITFCQLNKTGWM